MITLNKQNHDIKLVAVADNKTNEFIKDSAGAVTFISEDKTIYLVIKQKGCRVKQIKAGLKSALANYKKNLNIDLDSIINQLGEEHKDLVFNTVYETISFLSHDVISYKKDSKPSNIEFNIETSRDFSELEAAAAIKTEFINYARDLQDTPPNIGTSEYYAEKISKDAEKIDGLKVTVLGRKEAEKFGMGLFLGVNAGSAHEPRIVVMEYCGDSSKPKTGLVGKGICFDSGGYNLKPSASMLGMKFDMSGAAIMLSATMALAKAKAKANVVAVAMFTDNKIGQNATLPESVLTSMNGLTVEINNTDAEGRLVLADGMTYAIREKGVDQIIEASTLTGALLVALGSSAIGVFTHQDELWNTFETASFQTRERMWRLPIFEEHLERVKSGAVLGDLSNAVKGYEGSSTAAAFLNEFAEEKPFIHFDIAGTADIDGRGQGVLVKTLFEVLK
ncbi:leucyl aminopeptidase [Mesoplasma entomophilum]|uniref:Probable cytosol aminopeptidase n=1 Tax=Mesoplasma entomophilum TaxID=2149 RepID=A0A3S5XY97_9MOLU|nr:M17 family metallopeptidase [Mesoplasma entomophilum]ATQ35234.1 peptidase M17 [Mesoplasma entomophilum]ATZ19182.1 leucyl aminopeptidase [Mesoplasma entomophilum]